MSSLVIHKRCYYYFRLSPDQRAQIMVKSVPVSKAVWQFSDETSQPIRQLVFRDTTSYVELCCARGQRPGSLQRCLSLLTGCLMPRCPTISKAEWGAGTLLCPCVHSAKIWERKSLAAAEQLLLTLIPPSWKNCSPKPIAAIPLVLAFTGLYITPLISFCTAHTSSSVSQQWCSEDPGAGDFWRGTWAGSAPGSAWDSRGRAATRVAWKSLHLYSPCDSLLSRLQNSTEGKEMGRGKKESEKPLCSQG